MKLKSKDFKKINYFVLYDINDNIICYFNDFNELSKHLNYKLYDLVHEYNRHESNMITIVIDKKKYKLATFC